MSSANNWSVGRATGGISQTLWHHRRPRRARPEPATPGDQAGEAQPDVRNEQSSASVTNQHAPRRCRTCGLVIKHNREAHIVPEERPVVAGEHQNTRHLSTLRGRRPDDWCSIPASQRMPGFPLKEGARFPRRKR